MNIYSNVVSKAILICAITIISILIIVVISIFLYRFYTKKHYKKVFASKVYKTTLYNDYYLINDYFFKVSDEEKVYIPHIMFSDKYIYLIFPSYYEGSLYGRLNSIEDSSDLIMIDSKGKQHFEDNPFILAKRIANKFSISSNIPLDFIICVTLTNNECQIDVNQNDKYNYLIRCKSFPTLIKEIEKREVPPIKKDELKKMVDDLYSLNKKEK